MAVVSAICGQNDPYFASIAFAEVISWLYETEMIYNALSIAGI